MYIYESFNSDLLGLDLSVIVVSGRGGMTSVILVYGREKSGAT